MEPVERDLPHELWREIMSHTQTRKELESLTCVSRSTIRAKEELKSNMWSFTNPDGRYYKHIYLSKVVRYGLQMLAKEEVHFELPDYQTAHLSSLIYCVERCKLLGGSAVIISYRSAEELIVVSKQLDSDLFITGYLPRERPTVHILNLVQKIEPREGLHTIVYPGYDFIYALFTQHFLKTETLQVTNIVIKPFSLLSLREETTGLWYRNLQTTLLPSIVSQSPGRVMLIQSLMNDTTHYEDVVNSSSKVVSFSYDVNFVDISTYFNLFDSFICDNVKNEVVMRIASLCMQSSKTKYLTCVGRQCYLPIPLPANILLQMENYDNKLKTSNKRQQHNICGLPYNQLFRFSEMFLNSLGPQKNKVTGGSNYWMKLDPLAKLEDIPEYWSTCFDRRLGPTQVTQVTPSLPLDYEIVLPYQTELKRRLEQTLMTTRSTPNSFTIQELRDLLRERALPTSGKRHELARRLLNSL